MLPFGGHVTVILAQFLRMILRSSKSNRVQGWQGNGAAVQLLIVLNSSMFQMIMSVVEKKQDLENLKPVTLD